MDIIKIDIGEENAKILTGLNWHNIGSISSDCEYSSEPVGSIKGGVSWPPE